jgi:transposase
MSDDIEQLAQRLVIGHKRDGRSIYDTQAKRELVQACRQPGVSLAKVARKCGINANVLSNY